MVLGNVGHLVSEHAREFRLRLRREQEARMYFHEPSGERGGIYGVVPHQKELEVLTRLGAGCHNAPPDIVDILGQLRIVEKARIPLTDFLNRLLAYLALQLGR